MGGLKLISSNRSCKLLRTESNCNRCCLSRRQGILGVVGNFKESTRVGVFIC